MKSTIWLVASVVLISFASQSLLEGKGKPPKDPPPPTAPVEYVWIDCNTDLWSQGADFAVRDMNNKRIFVGTYAVVVENPVHADYRAFMCSCDISESVPVPVVVNMNTLNANDSWFDLDEIDGEAEPGWIAAMAFSINDSNQIVGYAINGLSRRTFLYDPDDPDVPEAGGSFTLLPQPLDDLDIPSYARFINEDGVVLGRYALEYTDTSVTWDYVYMWDPSAPDVIHLLSDVGIDGVGTPKGLSGNEDPDNQFFVITSRDEAGNYFQDVYCFLLNSDSGVLTYDLIETYPDEYRTGWNYLNQNHELALNHYIDRRNKEIIKRDLKEGGGITTVIRKRTRDWLTTESVNDAGDVIHRDDYDMYLYREAEAEPMRIYDLLNDEAKGFWENADVSNTFTGWVFGDDNFAPITGEDGYDILVGRIPTDVGHSLIALIPVEFP